ncbi:MAG: hypothetical protein SGPRY_008142 [Prymnesium sp.]
MPKSRVRVNSGSSSRKPPEVIDESVIKTFNEQEDKELMLECVKMGRAESNAHEQELRELLKKFPDGDAAQEELVTLLREDVKFTLSILMGHYRSLP